jgi:ribosomal protein S18 acetylase RimI-like enzyme
MWSWHVPTGDSRVRALRADDTAAAAELLAASHAGYPAFSHLWPDPGTRRRAVLPFLRATARDAAALGASEVAEEGQGIVAVALWLPPGTFPWSRRRQLRAVPSLLRTALAAPRRSPAFARLGPAAAGTAPRGSYWYLEALGVHPSAQRRGWGQRVLQPGLERADAAGLPCYVETSEPANADFYCRLGFEVAAPRLEHLPGGPAYTGLRRPPQA